MSLLCFYAYLKKYFFIFIQSLILLNKKGTQRSIDTKHSSFLVKKHQIFFFQRSYFLLLRSWTNSIHNPYKLITFLLAIFQGGLENVFEKRNK
jgi:hypothetical protein